MTNHKPQRGQILNNILQLHQKGVPMTAKFMLEHGVSYELQRRYVKSGWFEKIAPGLLKRANDKVDWMGALSMLQSEENQIVLGGKSALNFTGGLHYLYLGKMPLFLFGQSESLIPNWFLNSVKKERSVVVKPSTIVNSPKFDLVVVENGVKIKISNQIKALLEVMYLANSKQDLIECNELMEAKFSLNPSHVQEALEKCISIKAIRLFLFFAKKNELPFFNTLDLKKINLGSGKRSLVKNGMLDKSFNLILPSELIEEKYYEY
jgi:hypothetical protein